MRTVHIILIYGDRSVSDDGTVSWSKAPFLMKTGDIALTADESTLPPLGEVTGITERLYKMLRKDFDKVQQ